MFVNLPPWSPTIENHCSFPASLLSTAATRSSVTSCLTLRRHWTATRQPFENKSENQFKASLGSINALQGVALGKFRKNKQTACSSCSEPSLPSSTTTKKKMGGERFKQECHSKGRFPLKGTYVVVPHTTQVCLSNVNLHALRAHVHPNNLAWTNTVNRRLCENNQPVITAHSFMRSLMLPGDSAAAHHRT